MNRLESILVTGGAGFVGSALVRRLLAEPSLSRLVVLDNFSNGRREFLPQDDRLEIFEADIRDSAAMRRAMAEVQPGAVFHLAAIHFIPYCNAHPDEAVDVNIRGAEVLLDACRRHPPQVVTIASTAAVYPIHDGPCIEATLAPNPDDIYGLTKWANERQLALYANQTPSRCVAARLFNVIGPRETNPHVLPEIVEQLVQGKDTLDLGNVEPKRDYIHSDDVASALVSLAGAETPKFDAFNVGTGHEYSVAELVDRLSQIIGRAVTIRKDPARTRRSDRMHLVADASKLMRLTGWKPRYTLDTALRELWTWSKSQAAEVAS